MPEALDTFKAWPGWVGSLVDADVIDELFDPGVDISDYGNNLAVNASDAIDAALADLVAQGRRTLFFPAGIYNLTRTLTLPSRMCLVGEGSSVTLLTTSTLGTAIELATGDHHRLAGLRITGPGVTTDTAIGIDADNVNSAVFDDVAMVSFHTGLRLTSSINGGSVYNTFTNCIASTCAYGYRLGASGTNSNRFFACRANNCNTRGVEITDSNQNVFTDCQFEACALGFYVTASAPGIAYQNAVVTSRFEGNTVAWETGADVQDTQILYPHSFGTYTYTDGGTRTVHWGHSTAVNSMTSAGQNATGSWRFVRSANGGSETPAVVIADTATSTGTPVTLEIDTERSTGYFLRGRRASTTYFDIDATLGNLRLPGGGYVELVERTAPSAPATNAVRIYAEDNGAGKTRLMARFATGAVQVLATEP